MPTPKSRGLVQAMMITEARLAEELTFETIAQEVGMTSRSLARPGTA